MLTISKYSVNHILSAIWYGLYFIRLFVHYSSLLWNSHLPSLHYLAFYVSIIFPIFRKFVVYKWPYVFSSYPMFWNPMICAEYSTRIYFKILECLLKIKWISQNLVYCYHKFHHHYYHPEHWFFTIISSIFLISFSLSPLSYYWFP